MARPCCCSAKKLLAGKKDACAVSILPDLNSDIKRSYEYSDYYDDRIYKIPIFLFLLNLVIIDYA